MVEGETGAGATAANRKQMARWGASLGTLAMVGFAAWRLLLAHTAGPQPTDAAGGSAPAEFEHACVLGELAPGPSPLGGAAVSDFVAALHRPDAQLSWEKSATGYILRQTISDQLSKATKQNAFSFTTVDAGVVQRSLSPGDAPNCGPGGALLDRIIIGDQEIQRTSVYALALQIVGPTLVQKQAAARTTPAAQAPASPAAQPTDLPPSAAGATEHGSGRLDFKGQGEGTVDLTLRPTGPGKFKFDIGTSAPECGGEVQGEATEAGGQIVGVSSDDPKCRIHMTRTTDGMRVDEENCSDWHGPACAFIGELKSAKPNAAN